RNVETTAELLEWIRQESPTSKIVVASSAAIYGNKTKGPISEDLDSSPFSVYGYNKSIMEKLCQSYGYNYNLKILISRIFSVYGIGLRRQLLWDICNKLKENSGVLNLAGT